MMECPVQCGCNAHAAPGFFSLAGTAVKASGTDAQPDAAGSVLWGLGSFPNKQKIAFVSRKPCLQKSSSKLTLFADKSIILTGLLYDFLRNFLLLCISIIRK